MAGVLLETSLARLRASMATFREEGEPSRPLGRWDSVVMVEAQGSGEEAVEVQPGLWGRIRTLINMTAAGRPRLVIMRSADHPEFLFTPPIAQDALGGCFSYRLLAYQCLLYSALSLSSTWLYRLLRQRRIFGTPIHHLAFPFPKSLCPRHPLIIPVFFHVD